MIEPAHVVFRTAGVRAFETRYASAQPPLMERAGTALAGAVERLLAGRTGAPLIVAGPGNNGGDGFVAARLLKERGIEPMVAFAGDAGKLPADARAAFDAWRSAGGEVLHDFPDIPVGLVVDALFGIGLARPLSGAMAEWVARINTFDGPRLAVDIPSGLDADTGRVRGAAVRATHTLTFIAYKPGLLTGDGPDHCGDVGLDTLGLEATGADGCLITPDLFREHLQPRPLASHKGNFGSAGIVGGAPGMAGAALLAGRAALKLGAGRVYVGMLAPLVVDPMQPELMLRPAGEIFALATALAIGPGLGQSNAALELLTRALATPLPMVLDADALNLLAAHPVLMKHAARREALTVLTPHPAEAGRLLDMPTEAVQADRLAAALLLAERSRAVVVLKGCGSIVATADGDWFVNTSGNPGLASAGSGDVLTGLIAALLAQGWPARAATLAGVHLHGAAADALADAGCGPVGLAAGELIDSARTVFNRWLADA